MKRIKLSVSATRESLRSSFPGAAVFPPFFSGVSSVSQKKIFGGFVAPFLHPQSPVGTSNSKPTHWELGRPPQLLVLAWTMQHHAPKLQCVGVKRALLSLTPGTQGIHIPPALALMSNLRMETHGATVPQISASTSLCCKNYPSCAVKDLGEQYRPDNTNQL